MPKQTIVFINPAELSLDYNRIRIEREDGVYLRPIEDVRIIIIDNHSVHITIPLLNKLAENNVSVVFCNERHIPTTMLMDLESNGMQSKYIRGQLSVTEPTKKRIWKQIVERKIENQSLLLEKIGHGSQVLKQYYTNVKTGDTTNREAIAAKIYWKILFGKDFIRDRIGETPNNLLNYGYALLRSYMSRAIMDAGLLPLIGVFHKNYYDSFPLADDLMEPYRPFVDETVYDLYTRGKTEIDKSIKQELLQVFYDSITYDDMSLTTHSLAGIYLNERNVVCYPKLI